MGSLTNPVLIALLALAMLIMFALSLAIGRAPLAVFDVLVAVLRGESSLATLVFMELRVPRALLGAFVGASLGLAGAALQGLLRNPLAEPGIVGVSGCAAFGAVVAFYSGAALAIPLALPAGGIIGAFAGVVFLYLFAGPRAGTVTLILAGVAVNAFAAALTALALNLSSNPYAALEIVFWQMGSLADRSMDHVYISVPLMLLGWGLLLNTGRGLDALSLGEATTTSLGFNLGRLRLLVIAGTALAVGSAVAVSGVIGFVGLVVPHLLRPLVGFRPSQLLVASALGGATLVLAADVAVRLVPTGAELKLGVLTALIGAPFFILVVRRLNRVPTQRELI